MFVKLFSYHINPAKEKEYLKIQEEAERIYSRFIEKKTLHLQSKEDKTKWLEVHIYENEKSYEESIHLIDAQQEIRGLYKQFLEVITTQEDISEEDYNQVYL